MNWNNHFSIVLKILDENLTQCLVGMTIYCFRRKCDFRTFSPDRSYEGISIALPTLLTRKHCLTALQAKVTGVKKMSMLWVRIGMFCLLQHIRHLHHLLGNLLRLTCAELVPQSTILLETRTEVMVSFNSYVINKLEWWCKKVYVHFVLMKCGSFVLVLCISSWTRSTHIQSQHIIFNLLAWSKKETIHKTS